VIERMLGRTTYLLEWLEREEREFSQKENKNPHMGDKQWMERYAYRELHEFFFDEFLIIVTEWLEILVKNNGSYQTTMSRNWNLDLVRKFFFVSNPTNHAIDF
jgi:hypothetical protein